MNGGLLVRETRRRAGVTQRQLARAIGVSQPTIARMESGATSVTTAQLTKILDVCGLEMRVALVPRDDSDWSIAQANLKLDPDTRVRQHQAAVRFIESGRSAFADARG
jgi:transcriptional regulator with XRE-family HTH domain